MVTSRSSEDSTPTPGERNAPIAGADGALVCSPAPADLRREFAAWIEQLLAGPPVWYAWGGASLEYGMDCSGLVTYWVRQLGLDCPRWTTAQMQAFDQVEEDQVEAGDLALYPGHVMIVLPGGRVAGMSGGRRDMTLEQAKAAGARLRAFTSHHYRRDFRHFARIPFEEET